MVPMVPRRTRPVTGHSVDTRLEGVGPGNPQLSHNVTIGRKLRAERRLGAMLAERVRHRGGKAGIE